MGGLLITEGGRYGEIGFEYNFGADYGEAKKLFGDRIWDLFKSYSSGWSKRRSGSSLINTEVFGLSDLVVWR